MENFNSFIRLLVNIYLYKYNILYIFKKKHSKSAIVYFPMCTGFDNLKCIRVALGKRADVYESLTKNMLQNEFLNSKEMT